MNVEKISNQKSRMSAKYKSEVPNELVEEFTKKIPNLAFIAGAGVSILISAYMTFKGNKKELGSFVGLWAPTILLFGVYNKIVKLESELLEEKNWH